MTMFQDETQPENQLERLTPLPSQPASQDAEVQRKRMLIALGILLVALAAVVLRDWDFWFPPSAEEQEATVRSKSKSEIKSTAPATTSTPATPKREPKPPKSTAPAAAEAPFSASTERAALPPLQVEVVAGNRHTNVPAKSNAIQSEDLRQKIAKEHGWDPKEAEQHILGFSHTVTGVANAPDFGSALDELDAKGLLPGAEKYARMVIDNADIRDRLSGLGVDANEHETQARFSALASSRDGGQAPEGPGGSDNPGVSGPAAQPTQKATRLADSKRGKR